MEGRWGGRGTRGVYCTIISTGKDYLQPQLQQSSQPCTLSSYSEGNHLDLCSFPFHLALGLCLCGGVWVEVGGTGGLALIGFVFVTK